MGFPRNIAPLMGKLDTSAQAFINAAGITDATQKRAVDQLVRSLKSNALWSSFDAIWPIVGGTSTTHKYNLKDPRDLDAAYRLVFSGGLTHASTGITGNGSTGYCNTKWNPLNKNTAGMGIYSRTSGQNNGVDMGCNSVNSGQDVRCRIYIRTTGNVNYSLINTGGLTNFSSTDGSGFFQVARTTSSNTYVRRNTTALGVSSDASNFISTDNIYILAQNVVGSASNYSSRQFAFAYTCSVGFTTTQLDTIYNIVQAYQTTLGRNV